MRSNTSHGYAVACALGLALAQPAHADRVDDLSQVLVNDSSWRVRLQAAVVLGKLHDRRAVPGLMRALTDPMETVRGMAAQVLGDLGDQAATAAVDRARRDPSAFVRTQAATAYYKLVGPPPVAAVRPPPSTHGVHVEVGGIGSKMSASPELKQRLREFITRELQRTPGVTMDGAPHNGFLIDSAITSFSKKNTSDYIEISCEISLIVGKLPSKAMVMMTSGGASVQAPKAGFSPERERAVQVDVLEGAVHSAHENLLAFLKSQEHL